MRLNIIFFVFGVWLLQQQAALPGFQWAGLLLAACGVPALSRVHGVPAHMVREVLLKILCLGCGFLWAAACAQLRLSDALPPALEGSDLQVVGVIASLPQPYERSVRFEFDVERVLTAGATVPRRIALSWWSGAARETGPATPLARYKRETAAGTAPPALHPGERWQLTVRLRRPHGTANPHGFDYEAWLLERDIRATGQVRAKGGNRRLDAATYHPRYFADGVRAALRAKIQQTLQDRPYAGVLIALAVGEQRAIAPEQWQVFTRTGVNHLMSISGLHVTMVSGLVFALAYWLWRRSERLTLRLPARKAAVLCGLAAALLYTLLAGFAVPAQRTLYMLAVMALALWMGRMGSASTVLALALFTVTLIDPWAVLAPGFWLSFGAVAVIMFVTVGRVAQPHWLAAWARVQWAVTLGLVPPLLALFQQVSIVSPVANALAIPVVSLIVVPLTLAGMLLPFDFVLLLAHLIMSWCMAVLEWMSELPDAVWQQHTPPAWTVVVAVLAAAWLLLPRGFPARWLGVSGFLPLFLVLPPAPQEGELKLTVLDVGHGLSVVARTRSHALLYDTGPSFGPGADSGNRIIVPYLRGAGVRRLDAVVISHDDIDHTGGAVSVLQALPVERLFTSLPDMDPLVLVTENAHQCFAGQMWDWDGVRFEILHPSRTSYDETAWKDNDRSCVLMISTRSGRRILLPADIEHRAEKLLLSTQADALGADVLIVPHQGSKTSSTPAFVNAVDPRAVIFPVGYRNRFGHPHAEVMQRYRELGSRIYRTDRDGALTLHVDAAGAISIVPQRAVYRRYWQTRLVNDPVESR
ncbi:MAG: DNA internalization-related competence protein ComEC/Rec2 [Pseudomonadota bacterium]